MREWIRFAQKQFPVLLRTVYTFIFSFLFS